MKGTLKLRSYAVPEVLVLRNIANVISRHRYNISVSLTVEHKPKERTSLLFVGFSSNPSSENLNSKQNLSKFSKEMDICF